MINNQFDIYERIFSYVVVTIELLNKLPKSSTNLIFINQCTRSVTSIGANSQEADGSSTKKEFIHSFTIARKETKETIYWLRLISRTNIVFSKDADSLTDEGKEINAIISTILKKTQEKL